MGDSNVENGGAQNDNAGDDNVNDIGLVDGNWEMVMQMKKGSWEVDHVRGSVLRGGTRCGIRRRCQCCARLLNTMIIP